MEAGAEEEEAAWAVPGVGEAEAWAAEEGAAEAWVGEAVAWVGEAAVEATVSTKPRKKRTRRDLFQDQFSAIGNGVMSFNQDSSEKNLLALL